jgi:glycosyltransferase involved in cell wall biosynthesis
VQIAVAHEWLVTYAGSERVVEQLLEAFPGALLLTTVLDADDVPPTLRAARPSPLVQRLPGAKDHHEWFLPVMPLAWRARPPLEGLDAVISSSHACAKAVRVEEGTPHLCYCYTPMRYAWDFESERGRFPAAIRPAARLGMAAFRRWDRRKAARVDEFVAISRAVASRIERFYGRSSQVIHPPVRTDYFTPGGERGDHFLYVGRLVSYKRPDLVLEAFADLPYELVVVGEGRLEAKLRASAPPNVRFVGAVDDERLRELYRSARALVFPGEEDFGIVMVEALACGTPVIALGRGGAVDIVEAEVSGWLLERQSVDELRDAVRRAAGEELDRVGIRRRAEAFGEERFRYEIQAAVESLVSAKRGASSAQ